MCLVEKYLEKAEVFYDIDKIKYNLTDDGFNEKLFMDYDNDRQAMLMKFDGKKVRSSDNIVYDFENLVSEASERNQKDLQ